MKLKLSKTFAGAGVLLVVTVVAMIAWRAYQKKRHAATVAIVPGR